MKGFVIDGIVLQGEEPCLQIDIAPSILLKLSQLLISCKRDPEANYDDKRHLALRALGHQCRKADLVFEGDMTAQDAGFEEIDEEEDERFVA